MVVAGREVDDPLVERRRAVTPVMQEVPHVVARRVQLVLPVHAQKLRWEESVMNEVQGDTEEFAKPPVDSDLRCSVILPGQ